MLYNFQGLRFLFCCAFCIPLVSWLVMCFQVFFCKIGWEADFSALTRGDVTQIRVFVENRGIFPVSRVLVELSWKAPGEQRKRIRSWSCGLGGRDRDVLAFPVAAEHCGQAVLELKRAAVYDYLGIFRLPFGKKSRERTVILPQMWPVPLAVEAAYMEILQGAGEEKEGDLLLRDFRPGDSMHRIYWKMLAKGGDLQVRDYEQSGSVTILLQFREEFRKQADAWDGYLDQACSLLYFFAEEAGRNFSLMLEVVWPQGTAFKSCRIADKEDVQTWVYGLLGEEGPGHILREEEIPVSERVWHLEEDGRLYFGERCVYEE